MNRIDLKALLRALRLAPPDGVDPVEESREIRETAKEETRGVEDEAARKVRMAKRAIKDDDGGLTLEAFTESFHIREARERDGDGPGE